MPYLERMAENAPVYAALQNHQDRFWLEYGSGQYTKSINWLKILELFNIKTPLSLLMAAYHQFEAKDFVKMTQWLAVISIRYNVIGNKSPNEQEKIYNKVAQEIMQGAIDFSAIARHLRPVYPQDQDFMSAFTKKTMPSRRSNKKILFLLQAIEQHLSPAHETPSADLSLEHVLPFNPSDDWQESFGLRQYSEAIDRLGNMAILPQGRNPGQEPFVEKKRVLNESQYRINRHIAEYEKWNMDSLEGHQSWLAKQAQTVWRIAAFDQDRGT